MNISMNILNELARGKEVIINKIDYNSDKIIEHLILCTLYNNHVECNHWKKETHGFLFKIGKLKNTNKYPSYTKLRKWWLEGFEDTLLDDLDAIVSKIEYDYGDVNNYDKDRMYRLIIDYFEWLLYSLSIKGNVLLGEVFDKIDELIKIYYDKF